MVYKTLFTKKSNAEIILVQIYVDDIIFGATQDRLCEEFVATMKGEFEMSMMGELSFFLGLQVKQTKDGIFLSQSKYCKEILKKFEMENCKEASTPMPSSCYMDADAAGKSIDQTKYRGCKLDRKSTSGTCHLLCSSLISWHSKKQACVAISTAEAEYIAAGSCCAQILWLKQQLADFGLQIGKVPLMCDNTSAINLTKNQIQHSRTKHIEIRHHFIRDHVQNGNLK